MGREGRHYADRQVFSISYLCCLDERRVRTLRQVPPCGEVTVAFSVARLVVRIAGGLSPEIDRAATEVELVTGPVLGCSLLVLLLPHTVSYTVSSVPATTETRQDHAESEGPPWVVYLHPSQAKVEARWTDSPRAMMHSSGPPRYEEDHRCLPGLNRAQA